MCAQKDEFFERRNKVSLDVAGESCCVRACACVRALFLPLLLVPVVHAPCVWEMVRMPSLLRLACARCHPQGSPRTVPHRCADGNGSDDDENPLDHEGLLELKGADSEEDDDGGDAAEDAADDDDEASERL